MGRPIDKRFFGPQDEGLSVKFHDGSSVVEGYIVKQMGTNTFLVTSNGTTTHKVFLAQTSEELSPLAPGRMTIEIQSETGGSIQHVRKIYGFTCFTVEGRKLIWNSSDPTIRDEEGVIPRHGGVPVVEEGQFLLVDDDGAYLIDDSGAYLFA